jgi:NAD(P)-dependent dehydrogenase (short-subunit alcohol dehydrogenase family)
MFSKAENLEELWARLSARQTMNRTGKPDEIATAFLFFTCNDCSFCTDSMLTVDGGMTAQ